MEPQYNVTFSRLRDKSLEAYKAWIMGFTFRLLGKTIDTRTDEQWEQSWKEFWQNAKNSPDE